MFRVNLVPRSGKSADRKEVGWLAAIAVIVSVGLSVGSSEVLAQVPVKRPSNLELVQELPLETSGYYFRYADDGVALEISLYETKRFRLLCPSTALQQKPMEEIASLCEQGLDRIEAHLGKFETKLTVCIPLKIAPSDIAVAKRMRILGLQFQHRGKEHFAVAVDALSVDIFAHEAFHYRLKELKVQPIWWLEEGIAEFVETEDGFNAEHLKALIEKGPIEVDALNKLKRGCPEEMQARATGWAIVVHLVRVKKHSLLEVAKASTVPTSSEAFLSARSQELPSRAGGAKASESSLAEAKPMKVN